MEKIICPVCGAKINFDDNFCKFCGNKNTKNTEEEMKQIKQINKIVKKEVQSLEKEFCVKYTVEKTFYKNYYYYWSVLPYESTTIILLKTAIKLMKSLKDFENISLIKQINDNGVFFSIRCEINKTTYVIYDCYISLYSNDIYDMFLKDGEAIFKELNELEPFMKKADHSLDISVSNLIIDLFEQQYEKQADLYKKMKKALLIVNKIKKGGEVR